MSRGLNYLASVVDHKPGGEYAYYLLYGDLCQMSRMEEVLRAAGFNVLRSQSGTYPGFREDDVEEFKKALKYLYDHEVEGWWNQKMMEYGICTQQEFDAKLQREIDRGK